MGCHLWQPLNQWALVKAGEEPPHKCLGTESDLFSGTSFPEKTVEPIGETPPRQHNSSCLYQQPRRYAFTFRVWPMSEQTESRTFIDLSDFKLRPEIIQCFLKEQRGRSPCFKTDQSVRTLRELAPRPTCGGNGRIFNGLESTEGICFPTIQSHSTNVNESNTRQCEPSTCCSRLANSTLAATPTTAHDPTSSTSSCISSSTGRPLQSRGNSSDVPETPTSRLDYFKQLCTTAGLSNTATRLLSSATRQSTSKSYNCAGSKWSSWCNRRKINLISAAFKDILTFLNGPV